MSSKKNNRQMFQSNTPNAETAEQQQQSHEQLGSEESKENQADENQSENIQDSQATQDNSSNVDSVKEGTEEKEITDPVKSEEEVQPKPTNQEGFKAVYKIELNLNSYAEAMDKNKSINPVEGGKWQFSLFTTIKSIFNAKDQEEFNNEWNTLLNFFETNKDGIFNENFIFRFPEYWSGSQTEFTTFRRLIHTILNTSNPVTRAKSVNFINLNMVTENMTEAHRNRLFNFYQI